MKYFILFLSIFISCSSWAEQPSVKCVGALASLNGENKAVSYLAYLLKKDYLTSQTVEKLINGNPLEPKDFEFKNVNSSQSLSLMHGVQAAFKDPWLKENWDTVVEKIKNQLEGKNKARQQVTKTKAITQSIWHPPKPIDHEVLNISPEGTVVKQTPDGKLILITDGRQINSPMKQVPIKSNNLSRHDIQILENNSDSFFILHENSLIFNSSGKEIKEHPILDAIKKLRDSSIEKIGYSFESYNGKIIIVKDKKIDLLTQIIDYESGKVLNDLPPMRFKGEFSVTKNSYIFFSDSKDDIYIYDLKKNEVSLFLKKDTAVSNFVSDIPIFDYLNQNGDLFYFMKRTNLSEELLEWDSINNSIKNLGQFSVYRDSIKLKNGTIIIVGNKAYQDKHEFDVFISGQNEIRHYAAPEDFIIESLEEAENSVNVIFYNEFGKGERKVFRIHYGPPD